MFDNKHEVMLGIIGQHGDRIPHDEPGTVDRGAHRTVEAAEFQVRLGSDEVVRIGPAEIIDLHITRTGHVGAQGGRHRLFRAQPGRGPQADHRHPPGQFLGADGAEVAHRLFSRRHPEGCVGFGPVGQLPAAPGSGPGGRVVAQSRDQFAVHLDHRRNEVVIDPALEEIEPRALLAGHAVDDHAARRIPRRGHQHRMIRTPGPMDGVFAQFRGLHLDPGFPAHDKVAQRRVAKRAEEE